MKKKKSCQNFIFQNITNLKIKQGFGKCVKTFKLNIRKLKSEPDLR